MLGYRLIAVTPREFSLQNMLLSLGSGYQILKLNFFRYSKFPKTLSPDRNPIAVNIISYHSYKDTLYKATIKISCSTRLSLSQNKATTSFKPCINF